MKKCSVCKLEKELAAFGPRKGIAHGRAACRSCDNAYQTAYRARNREACRARGRMVEARRRADPRTRAAVLEAQRRAYRNGGKARARAYLEHLKHGNFFAWKARKSYVWLTAEELRTLWQAQGGRCALTGRALDATAELDHIIPKSRGGVDSLQNARWLSRAANQAKRDLLDNEFLDLCAEVCAHAHATRQETAA